ncbi:hypothetical protein D3C72_963990 [compost metagenome]
MAVHGAAIGVQHLTQATLGETLVTGTYRWRGVVVIAHVQVGIRIGDTDKPIERVVAVGGSHAARIGAGLAVASSINGESGVTAVRADLPGQITKTVVGVGGVQPLRVGHLGDLVECVVAGADLRSDTAHVLQGLRQPVQWIVLLVRHPLQGIGDRLRIAIGVVRKAGGVVAGILQRGQLPECVVDTGQRAAQRTPCIDRVFLQTVAGVVQGVVNGVAGTVGNVREPLGGVVDIGDAATVGLGDLLHLAGGPIAQLGASVFGSSGATHGDRRRPAAGVVGVIGDYAVGVLHRQLATERVVSQDLDRLTESIGDAVQVALAVGTGRSGRTPGVVCGVVRKGADIGHLGARTIHTAQQTDQRAPRPLRLAIRLRGDAGVPGQRVAHGDGGWLQAGIASDADLTVADGLLHQPIAAGSHPRLADPLLGGADRIGRSSDIDHTQRRIIDLTVGMIRPHTPPIDRGPQAPRRIGVQRPVTEGLHALRIGKLCHLSRRIGRASGSEGVHRLLSQRVGDSRRSVSSVLQAHTVNPGTRGGRDSGGGSMRDDQRPTKAVDGKHSRRTTDNMINSSQHPFLSMKCRPTLRPGPRLPRHSLTGRLNTPGQLQPASCRLQVTLPFSS